MDSNFIPECLTKDVKKLFPDYLSNQSDESLKIYKIELVEYNIPASEELFHEFINIKEKYNFSNISDNSDIVTLRVKSASFLGFIESTKNINIIRYWKEAERYFIIRFLDDDKRTLIKYIKIFILFPTDESVSHIKVIVRVNKKHKAGLSNSMNQVIEIILSFLKHKLADFIVFYKNPLRKRKTLIDLSNPQLKNFNILKSKIENSHGYEIFSNDELIRALIFSDNKIDKAFEWLLDIRKIYLRYYKNNATVEPILEFLGTDVNKIPVLLLKAGIIKKNTIIEKIINSVIHRVEEALALNINGFIVIADFKDFLIDAMKLLNDIVTLIKTLTYAIEFTLYIKNYEGIDLKDFVEKGILINSVSVNIYSRIIPKEYLI
jgi:hypothetical protein